VEWGFYRPTFFAEDLAFIAQVWKEISKHLGFTGIFFRPRFA
jgi:hypothetical protein